MGLPHPGMHGIIHVLKVILLHPLVLVTKALGVISLLVVISLLEPSGEGVEGTLKSLPIWVLVLSPFSTSKRALYFVSSVGFAFCSHCGIASNDYHPLLTVLKYCALGQLLSADVIQIPRYLNYFCT